LSGRGFPPSVPTGHLGQAGRSSHTSQGTGLRPFRYHALRGNPSGEEVRDDPHSDSRRGSNRCSVAPTAPPLKARVGAFGLRPLYCPWPRFLGSLSERGLHFAPLRVARDLGWCDHDYPRWGAHTPESIATSSVLGAPVSLIRPVPSTSGGSGPSLAPVLCCRAFLMYIRPTSLRALYIRNTRRCEPLSSASLAYRGGAICLTSP
jgi:hypothetical protein